MREFDFHDFLAQFKMMRRMGPLDKILKMLPDVGDVSKVNMSERQMRQTQAIVYSMTFEERSRPEILTTRRRERIAKGSGRPVAEVDDLIRRFGEMKKMMRKMPRRPRRPGDDEPPLAGVVR